MSYAVDQISDPSVIVPSQEVLFVEECSCSARRQGQLCDQCSPGYTFDPSFGGGFSACVSCYCNGRSETCDPVSGVCLDCRDNRAGDDCEKCAVGYYHNLTTWECLPCPCPGGPSLPNQFADGCSPDPNDSDRVACNCYTGFTGDHCESCDTGYVGDPLASNGDCKVCDCNGNTVISGDNCDPVTGECICRQGYVGNECQFCDEGYFGDALQQNCTGEHERYLRQCPFFCPTLFIHQLSLHKYIIKLP